MALVINRIYETLIELKQMRADQKINLQGIKICKTENWSLYKELLSSQEEKTAVTVAVRQDDGKGITDWVEIGKI